MIQQRQPQQQPPIYVRPEQEAKLTGIWGQAVRLCGLDCYGPRLLRRRAVIAMKAFAVLLTVNFFFDLGAWGLLFNAIFGGGSGIFNLGLHSLPALIASLLISLAVVIYEQQFMTSDIT